MSSTPSLEILVEKVNEQGKQIEEIKTNHRERDKVLMDAIESLKENSVRQTTLMEKMEERAAVQDLRLDKLGEKMDTKFEKMDEKLDRVNLDVQTIKTRSEAMESNEVDAHTKWYQGFILSDRKNLWLFALLLLCGLLGYKAQDIIGLLM